MQISELTLTTDDGPMDAYEAAPDGGARRAVIVIQEAFGVNDHIQDVARRFANEGYLAAAPSLFHRAGGGTAPYDDFNQVIALYEGLDDAAILTDVDATLAHLAGEGVSAARTGIVAPVGSACGADNQEHGLRPGSA